MITDVTEQEPSDFRPDEVAKLARKHRDVVVGVKSAHYQRPDWLSVDRAVEAGKLAGIPVMVDFGYFLPERPYWQLVTEHLRPGDISTHMFRGPVPYVDENGKIAGVPKAGARSRREVRCRSWRRQFCISERRAGRGSGFLSGLDLYRSALRQHEWKP